MTQITATNVRSAIEAANRKFVASYNQGDAATIGTYYTGDARLLPPNADFIAGKQAIAAFWKGAMDMGVKSVTLETVEVEDFGQTANEVGQFSLLDAGNHVIDSGKYIVVWKLETGQWKLHRDVWNSSRPAAR